MPVNAEFLNENPELKTGFLKVLETATAKYLGEEVNLYEKLITQDENGAAQLNENAEEQARTLFSSRVTAEKEKRRVENENKFKEGQKKTHAAYRDIIKAAMPTFEKADGWSDTEYLSQALAKLKGAESETIASLRAEIETLKKAKKGEGVETEKQDIKVTEEFLEIERGWKAKQDATIAEYEKTIERLKAEKVEEISKTNAYILWDAHLTKMNPLELDNPAAAEDLKTLRFNRFWDSAKFRFNDETKDFLILDKETGNRKETIDSHPVTMQDYLGEQYKKAGWNDRKQASPSTQGSGYEGGSGGQKNASENAYEQERLAIKNNKDLSTQQRVDKLNELKRKYKGNG